MRQDLFEEVVKNMSPGSPHKKFHLAAAPASAWNPNSTERCPGADVRLRLQIKHTRKCKNIQYIYIYNNVS